MVKIGDFGLATDKPTASGTVVGGVLDTVVAHAMTGDLTDEDVTKGTWPVWRVALWRTAVSSRFSMQAWERSGTGPRSRQSLTVMVPQWTCARRSCVRL